MTFATVIMAIAAVEAEALHRNIERGVVLPGLVTRHAGRFVLASLLLVMFRVTGS